MRPLLERKKHTHQQERHEREREREREGLLPGVKEMEGRQVGHVPVDLDGGGLCSRDGLELVKIHPEKLADGDVVEKNHILFPHFESADARVAAALRRGGEEFVGRFSNDRLQDGGFAARRFSDAPQLKQFVASDASTSDENEKREEPHVDGSNVAQHPRGAGGEADVAIVVDELAEHDAVNAAQFSPRFLRHQHVVKEAVHFGLFSSGHERLEELVEFQVQAGGGRAELGQHRPLQSRSFFFFRQLRGDLSLNGFDKLGHQLVRSHLPRVEDFRLVLRQQFFFDVRHLSNNSIEGLGGEAGGCCCCCRGVVFVGGGGGEGHETSHGPLPPLFGNHFVFGRRFPGRQRQGKGGADSPPRDVFKVGTVFHDV